jgi:hypothetical protein
LLAALVTLLGGRLRGEGAGLSRSSLASVFGAPERCVVIAFGEDGNLWADQKCSNGGE